MRSAILHLAFAGLDAREAYSGGWTDNVSSLGVSRSLGYEENGRVLALKRDEPAELLELRLSRSAWEGSDRPEVRIDGLDECLEFFVDATNSPHM
jgi:hypothetical protein